MANIKQVTLLGSTGSIGQSALEVISLHPDRFRVVALTAHSRVDRLFMQCLQFKPEYAVVVDQVKAKQLQQKLASTAVATKVLAGEAALIEIAADGGSDTVIAGIVGAAGLEPTLAAVNASKTVLLANKEPLVMTGQLFMDAVKKNQATLLALDSEHNAVMQCLPEQYDANADNGVESITITASGGPFLHTPVSALAEVTPADALKHPNWKMGPKISVDSATMMNKGLEIIEAKWLFDLPVNKINALIHPQSLLHALVNYRDGSSIAHLANADMKTPIAHALAYPQRINAGVAALDLASAAALQFFPIDSNKFPCFKLAYQAIEAGGAAMAVLNAANEIAVEAFLAGKIRFLQISETISDVLNQLNFNTPESVEQVLCIDQQARQVTKKALRHAVDTL